MHTKRSEVQIQPLVVAALSEDECCAGGEKLFDDPVAKRLATLVLHEIERFRELPSSRELRLPAVRGEIVKALRGCVEEGEEGQLSVETLVDASLFMFERLTIDMPRISLVSTEPVSVRFADFNLDGARLRVPPGFRVGIGVGPQALPLHDFLIREIFSSGPFTYDRDLPLIRKIAGQAIEFAREHFGTDYQEIVRFEGCHSIAGQIFDQFYEHEIASVPRREAVVEVGFLPMRSFAVKERDLKTVRSIPRHGGTDLGEAQLFGGFSKCLYGVQRLENEGLRRWAAEFERDSEVLKWFRPAPGQFEIYWGHRGEDFVVDFVVETETERLLYDLSPKAECFKSRLRREVAKSWCLDATNHALEHGAKGWRYIESPL